MKTVVKATGTILLLVLLGTCSFFQRDFLDEEKLDNEENPGFGFGTLEIDFGSGLKGASTLLPPVTMEVGDYVVSGNLDGGEDSFTTSTQAGGLTRYGLTPGLWNITVDALSTDEPPVTIGRGTTTAQIDAWATTYVQVTISPLPGDGTLEVTAEWSKSIFKSGETVVAKLDPVPPGFPPDGDLPFTNPQTQAAFRYSTCSSDPIQAGYYLLTLQLFVDDVLEDTLFVAVRILSGQVTSGTLTFTP